MTKKYLNDLTYEIIGAAIEVHKSLRPGLLESVYHKCMKQELFIRKLTFSSEFIVPVSYKGIDLDAELRCDLLVEDAIVIEIKAVDAIAPVYEAQLLTYMQLLQKPKGILINFNCSKKVKRLTSMSYFAICLKNENQITHMETLCGSMCLCG